MIYLHYFALYIIIVLANLLIGRVLSANNLRPIPLPLIAVPVVNCFVLLINLFDLCLLGVYKIKLNEWYHSGDPNRTFADDADSATHQGPRLQTIPLGSIIHNS